MSVWCGGGALLARIIYFRPFTFRPHPGLAFGKLRLSQGLTTNQGTQLWQLLRSPQSQSEEMRKTKVSDVDISHREVVSPGHDAPQDRHELQSKLETLESVGCSQTQIVESPEILLLSEPEILRRYRRLRHCGVPVSVVTLKLGHQKSETALREKARELQQAMAGNDTLEASMAGKLRCNQLEWHRAKNKYVYLRNIRDMQRFNTKVDYLFNVGYSIDEIKRHIVVLNKGLACLKTRVLEASEAKVLDKLTLQVLNLSEKAFSKWLLRSQSEKTALGEFTDRFEMFANLLNTTVDDVKEVPALYKSGTQRMKENVELLLHSGLEPDDILCHAHILMRNRGQILKGLEKLTEMGFSNPSTVQIMSIMNGRKVCRPQMKKKELSMLARLLKINVKYLECQKLLLKETLLRGKFALRESINYLQAKGFEGSDIVECPILLGHDLSVLRSYVENYQKHKDFEKFESLFNGDKRKILNWIQYLIERDINFSSQQAVVEDHEGDDADVLE